MTFFVILSLFDSKNLLVLILGGNWAIKISLGISGLGLYFPIARV